MDIHSIVGTVEEQIEMENISREQGVTKFLAKMQKDISEGRLAETPYGAVLMKLGFKPYRDKLKEYLEADLHGHTLKQRKLLELISDDVDVIAYEVITTVLSHTNGSSSLTRLANALMRKLFDNYIYGKIKENNPKLHSYLGYEFKRATKRKKKELIEKNIKSLYDVYSVPEEAIKLQVGTTLIELLELSGANLIEIVLQVTSIKPRRTTYTFRLTDDAMTAMEALDGEAMALQGAERAPCIVPPLDWSSPNNGGYYTFNDRLINYGYSAISRDFQKVQDYSKVFPIINKLQHTPWRVNADVYKLVKEVFEKNLPIGGLPSSTAKTWKDYMEMPVYDENNKEPWVEANKKRQQIQIDLDVEFSKRIMLMYSLGTAAKMLKYTSFYYSYQLDYRGRVYPTSTHLNLLGKNEVKAMIEFGEGQYLTPDGLRWLKIHIANTHGLDKALYDVRVAWVDDNYKDILGVASDPLGNADILGSADSPFEFYAACVAYNKHLNGDPVHLPIQLDATCSGIQMYSGLLLDKVGAKSVNVIGSDRNDIYQQVANGVEYKLRNNEYDSIVSYTKSDGKIESVLTDATAISLRGNISRKLVKRPTMTVPYSVTMMGMREQIDEELASIESKGMKFWVGDRWVADKILTQLVSDSIYSILDGAKKGQEYLVKLSRTLDEPAVWYSPIYDFPVHQNTIDSNRKIVKTVYGELTIRTDGTKHNKRKQANQIAPNFIHCIDSTVLLGVIEEATDDIGTIHDCFLVHPNSGYEVQEGYKKSFVEVMETDPLRKIQQQLDPMEEVEFPDYGSLDLNDVYDAQYIIS